MSLIVRRLIACMLIAFVPLQATAASRLALCAEMGAMRLEVTQLENAPSFAPCAHMDSMTTNAMTANEMPDAPSASHHNGACWLGSICLAGLTLPPMPVSHVGINIERNTQTYFAQASFFHSIVPETPLRPPTTL